MFRVGQKVVCVRAGRIDSTREWWPLLREGEVYTIRDVLEFPWEPDREFGIAIRVDGIVREDHPNPIFSDYPFRASRFRPIVEKKTDIAIFHEILNKVSRKHKERV